MRRVFHFLNKFFMVPLFRLGFGPFFGNPFTGYIMVLKVIGRKTGKVRYAPVNFAIQDGKVYCISGFRKVADWYKNLRARSEVEVLLPAGAIKGHVCEVEDPQIRRVVIRKILKNAGFAGFFEGYNPFTIGDEALMQNTADIPLICIEPVGLANGASDPGGWAWVSSVLLILVLILALR